LIHFYKRLPKLCVMAQGKIKTKGSKPPPKKNKPVKNKGGVKKGKFNFAAKTNTQNQIQKFKKEIQKGINKNIEAEVKAIALKHHEGKAFKAIGNDNKNKAGTSSN